jgi:hypothetical protein
VLLFTASSGPSDIEEPLYLMAALLELLLLGLVLVRVSPLGWGREALFPRCDGGIEIGGASLCVLRERP